MKLSKRLDLNKQKNSILGDVFVLSSPQDKNGFGAYHIEVGATGKKVMKLLISEETAKKLGAALTKMTKGKS